MSIRPFSRTLDRDGLVVAVVCVICGLSTSASIRVGVNAHGRRVGVCILLSCRSRNHHGGSGGTDRASAGVIQTANADHHAYQDKYADTSNRREDTCDYEICCEAENRRKRLACRKCGALSQRVGAVAAHDTAEADLAPIDAVRRAVEARGSDPSR
jgi:hypothetical protein